MEAQYKEAWIDKKNKILAFHEIKNSIRVSMLVFAAAREKKFFWLYPIAILIHAMIDAPAALYQYQVISNIFVVEGVALVMGIVCMLLGIRTLRRR